MGKFTPIILLVAAVIVALLTSLATYNWLQEKRDVRVVKSIETVPVAVAKVNLPSGSVVTKEMVKTRDFMKGSLPEGSFFPSIEAVEGRVIVSSVQTNEPILLSRMAPENISEGGVPAIITEQKRAMSVKVDQIIGVAGFIKPGDRVDVLVTLSNPEGAGPVTKIILENMLVIATGTQVQKGAQGASASPVNVITLEVTPEEAEKIALATGQGRIQLALRGYKDEKEVFTKGATIASLMSSYRIGAPMKTEQVFQSESQPVPRTERTYTVWTINGSATQSAKIK
ncbi:Flp pilus assembly protein CpaB [Candidatus Moduliflexota bacterium]